MLSLPQERLVLQGRVLPCCCSRPAQPLAGLGRMSVIVSSSPSLVHLFTVGRMPPKVGARPSEVARQSETRKGVAGSRRSDGTRASGRGGASAGFGSTTEFASFANMGVSIYLMIGIVAHTAVRSGSEPAWPTGLEIQNAAGNGWPWSDGRKHCPPPHASRTCDRCV